MDKNIYEIERKFLIHYPAQEILDLCFDSSEIVQTYLTSEKGETARIRKRGRNGVYEYTHTVKVKISPMRRIENESLISEEEYNRLINSADPGRKTVYKTRYCLNYKEQIFEIDLYPFWNDRAVMEIELDDESQAVGFPPYIRIIREITGDKRYTNASIAKKIPEERV